MAEPSAFGPWQAAHPLDTNNLCPGDTGSAAEGMVAGSPAVGTAAGVGVEPLQATNANPRGPPTIVVKDFALNDAKSLIMLSDLYYPLFR